MDDEGIIEHARRLGDEVIGPELRRIAERHPSVGEVRGLGVLLGDRAGAATARPARCSCRTTPPAPTPRPMVELAAACKAGGVWPFTHFNRLHVVPPCTITDDEVRQGLAVIDEALAVADRYGRHEADASQAPPSSRVDLDGLEVLAGRVDVAAARPAPARRTRS